MKIANIENGKIPEPETEKSIPGFANRWMKEEIGDGHSHPPVSTSEIQLRASNNCRNIYILYWSWNYRGCWHQTCPPIVPR